MEALAASARALRLWDLHTSHPGIPLFSGGLVDAWPKWALEALAVIREERAFVAALVRSEQPKSKPKR